MADQFPQQTFEQLEADIDRLKTEVAERREMPENAGVPNQELLRQSIRAMAPAGTQPSPMPAPQANVILEPVPDYAQGAPAETKLAIEQLLDVAFHQGIEKANVIASSHANPFILDAFHDALTGKLYEEFKKRGLLE